MDAYRPPDARRQSAAGDADVDAIAAATRHADAPREPRPVRPAAGDCHPPAALALLNGERGARRRGTEPPVEPHAPMPLDATVRDVRRDTNRDGHGHRPAGDLVVSRHDTQLGGERQPEIAE